MSKKTKQKPVEIKIPLTFDNKEFFLVKYNDDWADEMTVDGWAVFSKDELEAWKKTIPKKNITVGLGTNEWIDYDSPKEVLEACEIEPLSIDEAKTLYKLFGSENTRCLDWNGNDFQRIEHYTQCQYGFFPEFDNDEDEGEVD